MIDIDAAKQIERLLNFAEKNKMIERLDRIPCRNALMDLFKLSEPYELELIEEDVKSPNEILDKLLDYAAEIGLLEENTTTYRDLLDARIMGLLMPRQSEIVRNFFNTYDKYGAEKATKDFYAISQASNYIRMDRIAKNLYWLAPTEYGDLEITINLSKPEKDPKEIASAKSIPQFNYPRCLLCLENVGFAGHLNHPARQNHRVIPIGVAGEQWYLQYSPYVYYNEHCILFHEKHVPMKISDKTFERLFDFVEQFPHYFIGSNADLPIVGGSILSHEHFQGGNHIFPMEKAAIEHYYVNENYKEVKAGVVKWPMSVIRLSSKDKNKLIELSVDLLKKWRGYSDEPAEILAYSKKNEENVPHNTITPIVRKNKEGDFEIDLVLRNNRTTEGHPDGLYHPHKELHHIKKENIGLIEVMGLAVLPARLIDELRVIEKLLTGETEFKAEAFDEKHSMHKHLTWIKWLIDTYGINNSSSDVRDIVKKEVGNKFAQVLTDAGVYKRDSKGKEAFDRFMSFCGFKNK